MEKSDFKEGTRYTLTEKNEQGQLRPANVYVYKRFDDFMIVRNTNGDGRIRKLPYDRVEKIVREREVPVEDRFYLPHQLLEESVWQDRTFINSYSSSPHMGK